jgi:quinohemoprotein ethanol dehydrogenase
MPHDMRHYPYAWALGLLLLTACHQPHVRAAASTVGAAANWTMHGGDNNETDFSALTALNTGNVDKLGLAYSLELPGEVSLEATPLAVDGVLYFTGSYGKVYAVDGARGGILWTYEPQIWLHHPARMHLSFAVNRGVAYEKGRVFSATLDGRLLALDAGTGRLLWQVETLDSGSPMFITGAPRAFRGKVVIGQGGADYGSRGYVTAYDTATGRQLWRFFLTPGSPDENRGNRAMEQAAATWTGTYWKSGTGGTPWDALTFDAQLNRLYIGTGNAGPSDPEVRSPGGGDNLYTSSIVAVDADSGQLIWHYQINPRDAWDYDCTQQMTLAQLTIDGRRRDVLMQAPKNGFFYVLDRHSGKLISAAKIGKVTWAERIDLDSGRPVESKEARYDNVGETVIWPNPTGAHNWQAMSYSPKAGLVFIPYMQNGVHYYRGQPRPWDVQIAGLSIGSYRADLKDGKGALLAWDPVAQKAAWKVQHEYIWNGGTLSTAGDLVFQGTADGYLSAYDSRSGRRLWHFNTGLGIIAPPMTYEVHGTQYVAILAGYGGSASIGSDVMNVGWKWGTPRRLLTFAVGRSASLAALPSPDLSVHALDDPNLAINQADAAAGRSLYMQCVLCHGRELSSGGAPGPDLRESRLALDREAFWSVVHDGSLISQGMPRFEDLTREQSDQLYAYIRADARRVLKNPEIAAPHVDTDPGTSDGSRDQ